MALSIKHTAVIGAGTMGRQIAAIIANSNTPVLLLDIVPRDTNDRNALAHKAIEKIGSGRSMLNERKLSLIQPGNIEDDLDKLENVDWIIECVPEKEDIKHQTYEKLGPHVKDNALVSSNTSTIPLSALKKDIKGPLRKQLCITHFFNPPAKLPLLELVTDQDNDPDAVAAFTRFADEKLGRNIIPAKDMPGFITNRIGLFWLLCAIGEARKEGISMEIADAIMDDAFGFPKTGIFALADMIGLKLIVDMADSMCQSLLRDDEFCQQEVGLKTIQERLQSANAFYLGKRQYASVHIGHWHSFLERPTPESRFACSVLMKMLGYAATVAPAIAENIVQIDEAMREGYGWDLGPFEIIDYLGPAWLMEKMQRQNMHVPLLLKQADAKGFFYRISEKEGKEYMSFSGRYRQLRPEKDKWTLALLTAGKKPVLQNASAELHDIGDGIACFAFTKGSMHVINEAGLDLLWQTMEKVESDFQGLIIGHDGKHFSAGLDLHVVLESAKTQDWERVDWLIRQGQQCMKNIKQSQVPIVAATCGYALGGGCELALHCTAVQAYIDTRMGLVESNIGVIPAWGGTKELLLRAVHSSDKDASAIVSHVADAFRKIASAKKSDNAEDTFARGWLHNPSRISVNRLRLLPDAKALCLELVKNFVPVTEQIIEVPAKTLYRSLMQEVMVYTQQEYPAMTQHRHKMLELLAEALSGYHVVKTVVRIDESPRRAGWIRLSEQQVLDSVHSAFMQLVQEEETIEKIKTVLKEF